MQLVKSKQIENLFQDKSSISTVKFHQYKELLFIGQNSGYVTTFIPLGLELYSRRQLFKDQNGNENRPNSKSKIFDIVSLNDKFIAISPQGIVQCSDKGVGFQEIYKPETGFLCSFQYYHGSTDSLLVGKSFGEMLQIPMNSSTQSTKTFKIIDDGRQVLQPNVTQIKVMPYYKKLVCLGAQNGCIKLWDYSTQRTIDTIKACTGGIQGIDVQNNYLVCTAFSDKDPTRLDSTVKIYDIRYQSPDQRAVYHLPQLRGPETVVAKFMPQLRNTLFVCSQSGLFSLFEINQQTMPQVQQIKTSSIDMQGSTIKLSEISPSGDLMAFSNSFGDIKILQSRFIEKQLVFGYPNNLKVNQVPVQVNPPQGISSNYNLDLEDGYAAVPTYESVDKKFSDLDLNEPIQSDLLPPRMIPNKVQKAIQQNQLQYPKGNRIKKIENPFYSQGLSDQEQELRIQQMQNLRIKMDNQYDMDQESTMQMQADIQNQVNEIIESVEQQYIPYLPLEYYTFEVRQMLISTYSTKIQSLLTNNQIKFSSSLQLPWYQASYYFEKLRGQKQIYQDLLKFSPIENGSPNSFSNALIQILFYVSNIRQCFLNHNPNPEYEKCLTCEIYFLFRMLNQFQYYPCQTTNFQRALYLQEDYKILNFFDSIHYPKSILQKQISNQSEGNNIQPQMDNIDIKEVPYRQKLMTFVDYFFQKVISETQRCGDPMDVDIIAPNPIQEIAQQGWFTQLSIEDQQSWCFLHSYFAVVYSNQNGARIAYKIQIDYTIGKSQKQNLQRRLHQIKTAPKGHKEEDLKQQQQIQSMEILIQESILKCNGLQSERNNKILQLPEVLLLDCNISSLEDLNWWLKDLFKLASNNSEKEQQLQQIQQKAGSILSHFQVTMTKNGTLQVTSQLQQDNQQQTAKFKNQNLKQQKQNVIQNSVYEYELQSCVFEVYSSLEEVDAQLSQQEKSYDGHLITFVKIYDYHVEDCEQQQQGKQDQSEDVKLSMQDMYGHHIVQNNQQKLDSKDMAQRINHTNQGSNKNQEKQIQIKEQWIMLNDDRSYLVDQDEVLKLYNGLKIPVLLVYKRKTTSSNGPQIISQPTSLNLNEVVWGNKIDSAYINGQPCLQMAPCSYPPDDQMRALKAWVDDNQGNISEEDKTEKESFLNLINNQQSTISMGVLQKLGQRNFDQAMISFQDDEINIREGTLVAIDAEFVALYHSKRYHHKIQEQNLIAKPRLSLARLSVVWGEGPLKGQVLIDDYITGVETVHDFLTPYSGINKGDLDPATSKRILVNMKSCYMKLRNIADQGVVFIGHGLKQDFKIIGMVVPETQSIDTVNLYWIRGKRKLSLRVLSKFFLGMDIQQETHDSNEDATAALELFHCYKYLCQQGTFHHRLRELYRLGNSHGWDYVGMDQGIALMTQQATYLSQPDKKDNKDKNSDLYIEDNFEKSAQNE